MNTAVENKLEELNEKREELRQESRKEAREQDESMQQMSRVSKILDANVENHQADYLGSIKELVVNPASGHVAYAVVSFGDIFGLGGKLFAVPWKALHWNCDKDSYIINIDKSTLKNAPGFDKDDWPDSSSEWERQRSETNQFYLVSLT